MNENSKRENIHLKGEHIDETANPSKQDDGHLSHREKIKNARSQVTEHQECC